jgi:hypothetical protein
MLCPYPLQGQSHQKRLRDVELVVPIAYGTISFWLGKRATEHQSHQWTVYVRAANNEDLSGVVKKVVFNLHPSFNNPTRGEALAATACFGFLETNVAAARQKGHGLRLVPLGNLTSI